MNVQLQFNVVNWFRNGTQCQRSNDLYFHINPLYNNHLLQVERKRHIGNDIAVIVFVDGDPDDKITFKPSSIRTKFTHVFAVIRYRSLDRSYW